MPDHAMTTGSDVTVVGLDGSGLPPGGAGALARAGVVVGGARQLADPAVAALLPAVARRVVLGPLDTGVQEVRAAAVPVVVLASGDPGFFGIVRRLVAAGLRPTVLPAVSSVALAFARAGLPHDTARVVSAHGRDARAALAVVASGVRCAVLTDEITGPAELAAVAVPGSRVLVAERLGHPDEQVHDLLAEDIGAGPWRQPNVVVVDPPPIPAWSDEGPARLAGPPSRGPWALPEDAFAHRDGMVTKAEVRAWTLARLGPAPGTWVWDVGAGSGSVAVEAARLGAAVVAVERNPEQCKRIRANAAAHAVHVRVLPGEAPGALAELAGLPTPDAVFVGGGGLDVLAALADPGTADRKATRVVVALAALDRVGPALALLRAAGYRTDGVQLCAARLADLPGGSVRLAATNPVVVLHGELDEGDQSTGQGERA
ncbi:MAG TPA: precorrin-6y C5,15-methyltransferase (decarboxylating) subunit CbiE [Motilibacteraceae bacterium]|nr:precorrin-6y C5,15-methyltransferase (decarboxylating) subunit CbiE [Motilibacteraceae bacterium]